MARLDVELRTRDSIRAMQLSRWCKQHNDLYFFCEHKHEGDPMKLTGLG